MANLPRLTENKIRQWTDPGSFSRGLRYYQKGYIVDPRIEGSTLKAQCRGSMPTPYRVEVTLGAQGIRSGHCSCPVGSGGHCKHAVALLLTWLHEPERFVETEPLHARLAQRSKEELIALIQRMLRLYPELEDLLALPVPGGSQTDAPVDPGLIRRQVENVLRPLSDGTYFNWQQLETMGIQLSLLAETGDAYAQRGEWENAVTVYDTVMRAILERYEYLDDDNGDLAAVVDQCAVGLGHCLDQVADPSLRERILTSLFHVYRFDVDAGGRGIGDEAAVCLMEKTTPEEHRLVASWLQKAIQGLGKSDEFFTDWRRQAFGGMLLSLQEAQMDDETFLAICRQTGRRLDLVTKLVELGRTEEAKAAAREASDYELMQIGDVLWAQGQRDLAEELIQERLSQEPQDQRLLEWLAVHAEARGDLAQALAYWQIRFQQDPSLGYYRKIRVLAQKLGTWEEVVADLLAQLAKTRNFTLLTEIFLEEGQVEQALEARQYVSKDMGWHPLFLDVKLAEAAEKEFPQEAIRIYMQMAEALIAARGRDNYAVAAGYLKRVRDIYRRLGQEEAWQALITRIRTENKTLRALKDELQKAGL